MTWVWVLGVTGFFILCVGGLFAADAEGWSALILGLEAGCVLTFWLSAYLDSL